MELKVWETDGDLTPEEEFDFLEYLGESASGEYAGIGYLVDENGEEFGERRYLAIWMTFTHISELEWLTEVGEFLKQFNPSIDYRVDEED